jgi:hypothetical protein
MSKAARLMHGASKHHIKGIARVIRYLAEHESLALVYDGAQGASDGAPRIFAFVDSDYGGEPTHLHNEDNLGRRSTSSILIMGMGGPIFWKSKIQKSVAVATGEAEFRALAYAIKEIAYCVHFLRELGFKVSHIPVFCDASVSLSHAKRDGAAWLEGTKQFEIELSHAYHMCREGMIIPLKVATEVNPADLMTKSHMPNLSVRAHHVERIAGGMTKPSFKEWLVELLGEFDGSSILRDGYLSRDDLLSHCGLK